MRQLFLDKGNLVIKEVAQPLLHDYSVLVSVHFAYIFSSTDLTNFDAQEGFLGNVPHKVKRVLEAVASHAVSSKSRNTTKPHTALGYSCSGHVVSVGKKVRKFAPGDYVACVDPGYSPHTDLICIPEQCAVKITNKKKIKAASLTTLAACALQALRRAQVQIGERVCIFGLDAVGLLVAQLAKLAGCTVIGIDTEQSRLDLAKKLGANAVYNLDQDTIVRELDLLTERHGIDVSFLVASSETHFSYAAQVTREKGKVVLLQSGSAQLDQQVWQKDIDILLSHDISGNYILPETSFTDTRWTDNLNMLTCLELIENGSLNVVPFIEEQITIQNIHESVKRIQKKNAIGFVLSHKQNAAPEAICPALSHVNDTVIHTSLGEKFVPAISDVLRVGIIGAGEFTQKIVLPHIAKLKNVRVDGMVDADISKSQYVAKKYDIKKTFAKQEELFSDNLIDVIVIASCHTFHADHALRALKEGKAVLLEKPMVTDFLQLQRMCSFLQKHKNIPFSVNYGLSFSPFAQKIKKMVMQRKTPLIMHYRINRELDHTELRTQSGMGAGRIIGDTCQIIDLFCYFTEAHPVSISVEAMHSARDDIFPTDNVSTQISFSDGSVCSLLYTTLGNADMGADRMELFYDGKAILMEDYMELYGFGLSSWFNETLSKPDQGYEVFMTHFFSALQQDKYVPPIDSERLHMVAEITLLIDKLACEGGGKKEL